MRALSTLTQLPTTKSQIKNYVQAVKDDILGGYINPLESAIILKSLEDIIKALRSDTDIKDYIWEESNKHPKSFDYGTAEMVKTVRTTYDYSHDAEWQLLKDQEAEIKAMIKLRENKLKPDLQGTQNEILTIKLSK